MSETLLEKHEALVVEMANVYLDNMQVELGRKYSDSSHEVNANLSDAQYMELRDAHDISNGDFSDLYDLFRHLKPTEHLQQVLEAFAASGGSVEIEPGYDEETKRLDVSVGFSIKDKTLEKIEGLSPLEDVILRMNAMLQLESVLSGADPDVSPSF